MALLGVGNDKTQLQAAGALAAIALDNPSNENSVATMLVNLLKSEVIETRTKAARAISRLARSHPSNQQAIAKVGGITPLVAMLADDTVRRAEAVAVAKAEQGEAYEPSAEPAEAVSKASQMHLGLGSG